MEAINIHPTCNDYVMITMANTNFAMAIGRFIITNNSADDDDDDDDGHLMNLLIMMMMLNIIIINIIMIG